MVTATLGSERDRLGAVRQARADLLVTPVLPIRPHVLPEDRETYWCTGCQRATLRRVFLDAGGWIWCAQCAASDEIGAAFTQAEIIALIQVMCDATERCSGIGAGLDGYRGTEALYREIAGELRDIRDALTLAPVNGPVAIPF